MAPWIRLSLGPVLVLLVLRIPSFAEPHWYSDEAGYITTAQSVLHGGNLYAQVWTNKPPLQIWTVALAVLAGGTHIWALHLMTWLTAAAALAGVAWFGTRHLGSRRTRIALYLAAVALGLPIADAELIVPETYLLVPIAWAVLLVADHLLATEPPRRRRLVIAGLLAAAAVAYQQTAVADTAACGLLILLRSPSRRRDLIAFAGTFLAVTAAWLTWAVLSAGATTIGFALVGFWGQYLEYGLPTPDALPGHALALGISVTLIAVGAWMTRRDRSAGPLLAVWLGAAMLVPAAAHHQYPHFLSPVVVPAALTLAALRSPLAAPRLWARRAPLLAGLGIATVMASFTGLDWMPLTSGNPDVRTLFAYYGGYLTSAGDGRGLAQWREQFDSRVHGDEAVADWLRRSGLNRETVVVWSSDAWVYALSGAQVPLPTAPIYNDDILLNDNGLLAAVEAADPTVIVTSIDGLSNFPVVQPFLEKYYRPVFTSDPDTIWLRDDVTVGEA